MADSADLREAFALAWRFDVIDVRSYGEISSQTFLSPDDAFTHYLRQDKSASQALFPFLDIDYYRSQLGEELPDSTSYFEHYVADGARQNLSPTPFFDLDYIAQQIDGSPPENVLQFLADSRFERVDPHVMFSKRYYRTFYVDIDNAGVNPFGHFLRYGWREKRTTHPFFRSTEYQRFNFPPACSVSDFNRIFMAACHDPALSTMQPMFDPSHYLKTLGPDANVALPLHHFLTAGWRDRISPFPLFDPAFYLAQTEETWPRRNPYIEYLGDLSHRFAPSGLFDPEYYLEEMHEAAEFRGSLLEHFVRFGAAKRARTHRSVVTLRVYPSRYSGLEEIASLRDASGCHVWLCGASRDNWLVSQLDDIGEVEPMLSSSLLETCTLHPYTGPLDQRSQTLIDIMVRIARCNCVVVFESGLGEWLVSLLASATAGLVSHARPWLTLLSTASPTLQYWHEQRGAGSAFDAVLPGDPADKATVVAQALITSLPERLVIRADAFGVALLRRCGTALLAAILEVSLLIDDVPLEAHDQRWFVEFLAAHFADFTSVFSHGKRLASIARIIEPTDVSTPRVVSL